jgi:epsilon-lactone hydrolase
MAKLQPPALPEDTLLGPAGVDARLVVFDALPRTFWYMVQIPEAQAALKIQADFFDRHLGN